MVDAAVGLFVALDALSSLLAATVAVFFWRSHRLLPDQGYAVLALAFAALGGSYLFIAASVFDLPAANPAYDAIRVGGQFLGAVLIFMNYAARRADVPTRTREIAAVSTTVGVVVYLVLYFAVPPRVALPEPLVYLPWLRLVEFFMLGTAAYLVAEAVHGRVLKDFLVPVAFLFLAISKYSTALLEFHGVDQAVIAPYFWRIAALLLLLRAVGPLGRWPRAPS